MVVERCLNDREEKLPPGYDVRTALGKGDMGRRRVGCCSASSTACQELSSNPRLLRLLLLLLSIVIVASTREN